MYLVFSTPIILQVKKLGQMKPRFVKLRPLSSSETQQHFLRRYFLLLSSSSLADYTHLLSDRKLCSLFDFVVMDVLRRTKL